MDQTRPGAPSAERQFAGARDDLHEVAVMTAVGASGRSPVAFFSAVLFHTLLNVGRSVSYPTIGAHYDPPLSGDQLRDLHRSVGGCRDHLGTEESNETASPLSGRP